MTNQFDFIVYRRDDEAFDRLLNSFSTLEIPEGYDVSIIETTGDQGVAAAYNAAMEASKARYKIYIDERAVVLRKNILQELLRVFQNDEKTGAVGVMGETVMHTSGVSMMSDRKVGGAALSSGGTYPPVFRAEEDTAVVAAEGFFLATQYDIRWREDLFHSESFYATAQCVEMRRAGYKTVILKQETPFVQYDFPDIDYDADSQKAFLDEYSKDVYPLVSVIIPTYNRPQYFKEALLSVLTQTYRNLDIFITDNSPGTETAEVMKHFFADDPRITYEHHPEFDKVAQWDRARAHNNPEATYVNWLMDDDLFAPTKIANMIDVFQENDNISIVTSYRKCIDAEGRMMPQSDQFMPAVTESCRIDGTYVGTTMLRACSNLIGEPTTVLVKKSCQRNNDFGWRGDEGEHMISDYPMWLHCLTKGDLYYMTEPLSFFRQHPGQEQLETGVAFHSILCWAMEIKYAADTKTYLVTKRDIRMSLLSWIFNASVYLMHAMNEAYEDVNMHRTEKVLLQFTEALRRDCEMSFFELEV